MATIPNFPQPHIPADQSHAYDPDGWTRVRCACGYRLHWCLLETRHQDIARFMDPATGQQVRTCPRCGAVLRWPSPERQKRGWGDDDLPYHLGTLQNPTPKTIV